MGAEFNAFDSDDCLISIPASTVTPATCPSAYARPSLPQSVFIEQCILSRPLIPRTFPSIPSLHTIRLYPIK